MLPTEDSQWLELDPLREMDFTKIMSMQDVYQWSQQTFVEDLYTDVSCAKNDASCTSKSCTFYESVSSVPGRLERVCVSLQGPQIFRRL